MSGAVPARAVPGRGQVPGPGLWSHRPPAAGLQSGTADITGLQAPGDRPPRGFTSSDMHLV